jgi:hypothetical protein
LALNIEGIVVFNELDKSATLIWLYNMKSKKSKEKMGIIVELDKKFSSSRTLLPLLQNLISHYPSKQRG